MARVIGPASPRAVSHPVRPCATMPDTPPKSPAESLKCFQARPGFRVELAAAEPLVQSPVAFEWGADGRLWVVECYTYPQRKPGDKGAAALMEYCARPAEDTLLLISLPKLDGSAQKTKWGKALVEGAQTQFIQIWPVDVHQLPQWINQRLGPQTLTQRHLSQRVCKRIDAGRHHVQLRARVAAAELVHLPDAHDEQTEGVVRSCHRRADRGGVLHRRMRTAAQLKPGAGDVAMAGKQRHAFRRRDARRCRRPTIRR